MALYLREDDIAHLLRMDDVIAAVEEAFRRHGQGAAANRPRQRVQGGGSTLHVMAGGLPALKALASPFPHCWHLCFDGASNPSRSSYTTPHLAHW